MRRVEAIATVFLAACASSEGRRADSARPPQNVPIDSSASAGASVTDSTTSQPFAAPWYTVFVDPAFRIAVDTSRVERLGNDRYLVWLQTRWNAPRQGRTKQTATPFNRELIHTFLRCDPTGYKVVQTVVSLNDGPPIDSVGVGQVAAKARNWAAASAGSADAGAAEQACAILRDSWRKHR